MSGSAGRPRVDVGVVTWNTASLTSKALRHLLDTDQGCDLRVLVQDNASSDGTAAALARVVPEAEVEISPANVGFARGVNRLIARSDAPWFLALNSDAWPEPGAVRAMVDAAEAHPRAAAVAPRLLRPDGTLEHSTHPFPWLRVALLDAVEGRRWLPRSWQEHLCLEGAWEHDRRREVDWAVGAALLMRRSALRQLGDFDERFFMYVEDLEWCWRATRHGWRILFEPAAVVRHVGNASGESRFGQRRAALEAANVHLFLRTARGPAVAAAYRGLTVAGLVARLARTRRRDPEAAGYWRYLLRVELGLVPPPPVGRGVEYAGVPDAPAPGAPDVAVVVTTRNRGSRLKRLVSALEAQSLPHDRFEVVIVDDASTDDTGDVLAELEVATTLSLRVLRRADRGGAAAGRNTGWRATSAPVVAFTDDDCVPAPGWLEAGLEAMAAGAGIGVGRTAPPPEQLPLARRPFALVLDISSDQFMETCNVFYRRADLQQVGGFDERFRRPSGEDTDLGLRVLGLGRETVFVEKALVHHDVRVRTGRQAVVESFRWRDLALVVRARPWSRRRLLHRLTFWKPSHPSACLALVGLAACTKWRPALLLLVPWVRHRWTVDPVCADELQRLVTLPAAFAVDAAEVVTMGWGSVRHRTVLL